MKSLGQNSKFVSECFFKNPEKHFTREIKPREVENQGMNTYMFSREFFQNPLFNVQGKNRT